MRTASLRWMLSAVVLLALATQVRAADDGKAPDAKDGKAPAAADGKAPTNKMCPVMTDDEAEANIFTEYKGQKVYFCCKKCVRAFQKDPEKYMKNLAVAKDAGGAKADAKKHDHDDDSKEHEHGEKKKDD